MTLRQMAEKYGITYIQAKNLCSKLQQRGKVKRLGKFGLDQSIYYIPVTDES